MSKTILPKKQTKTIRIGDYLKKVQYANRFLINKYDVYMMADGYFMFKKWGKGKIMWSLTYATGISGGIINENVKRGARMMSLVFDDDKTPYLLKADIIETMKKEYETGYWTKGKLKDKHQLEPKDIEDMRISATSRWFK